MGRRALRKLDPTLDLSDYLFQLESVPKPFDAQQFFGRVAPLDVEIGSGKGLFLQNATASQPDHLFLGLEIARKYAAYCAARLARRGVINGKVICGDGGLFFRDWLTTGAVRSVHIYFPDPWWKKRHKKRRVLNENLVREIERTLEAGGELQFWTDVEEYFETTLEMIAAHTSLAGPQLEPPREPEHDLDYRTHFERRCRREQQPVYRAVYRKGGAACHPT